MFEILRPIRTYYFDNIVTPSSIYIEYIPSTWKIRISISNSKIGLHSNDVISLSKILSVFSYFLFAVIENIMNFDFKARKVTIKTFVLHC